MKTIRLGLVSTVLAVAQVVPPTLMKKVEAEYAGDVKSYVMDSVVVRLVIDTSGKPYSIQSSTGLPDNVVEALIEWRFKPGTKDGHAAEFEDRLNIPIKTPASKYLQGAERPADSSRVVSWAQPGHVMGKLTPEEAADLERKLSDSTESVGERSRLLEFAASQSDPDAAAMRERQIAWLARNAPGAFVLGTPAALLPPTTSTATSLRVRDLWIGQVSKNPDDIPVLAHATYFLQLTDPEKAEQMLTPVLGEVGAAAAWLGELYARAALGSGEKLPDTGYALHARTLASTKDERILLGALATVTRRSRNATAPPPEGYGELCNDLLRRVKAFYPDTTDTCDAHADPPRTGGTVTQARLIRRDNPKYPADAKAHGIQGTVIFSGDIGADGKLYNLGLLSGPLALYRASRDSLANWEYEPTKVNGSTVNFQLGR